MGLLAVLLYTPSLNSGFVYDDVALIDVDSYIHQPAHFGEVLSLRILQRDMINNNRPLVVLCLMVTSLFSGKTPLGYHAVSVVLHGLCTGLLFVVLVRLLEQGGRWRNSIAEHGRSSRQWHQTGQMLAAATGALVFAAHPVNTEAVALVSYCNDLLVTAAVLGVLVLATGIEDAAPMGRRVAAGVAIVVLMFLAATAKESAAAGPVILLLYWLVVRRARRPFFWGVLVAGAFGAVAGFLALRFKLEPAVSQVYLVKPMPVAPTLLGKLTLQARIMTLYVQHLVWPVGLSIDYQPQAIAFITDWLAWCVCGVIALVVGLLSWWDRRVLLASAIFVVALGPVSNLVPIYHPVADRYLYLPNIGVASLLSAILAHWVLPAPAVQMRERPSEWALAIRHWVRVGVLGLCTVAIACLAAACLERQSVCHDRLSLWGDEVDKNPQNGMAQKALADAQFDAAQFSQALVHWKLALDDFRRLGAPPVMVADCWAGLAMCHDALDQRSLAEDAYRMAVKLEPRYTDAEALAHALFWSDEEIEHLAVVARRTGLWKGGNK
jgi:hypothetical protein